MIIFGAKQYLFVLSIHYGTSHCLVYYSRETMYGM